MPGHVEADDVEPVRNRRIIHQMAVLAAVSPGGVKTDEGNALACFLDEDAVIDPPDRDFEITPDDGLELRHEPSRRCASAPSCDATRAHSAWRRACRPPARTPARARSLR